MNTEETTKTGQEAASFDPAPNTEFVREKIKQKPINRRKLLRRTLLTVMAAAIFGVVACVTFFLLEPFISSRLNSERTTPEAEEQVEVSLTDTSEDASEEMLPEDMYLTDTEMISEALQGNTSEVNQNLSAVNQNIRNIEDMISSIKFGLSDYQRLYIDLRTLAENVSKSLVTVTGATEELDLLNNPYENHAQVSGVIVADNGPYLLILVRDTGLTAADSMEVSFDDGTAVGCDLIGRDEATGLLIVGVRKNNLPESTLAMAVPASLGTSRSSTLKGTPVIALGSPTGIPDSFAYGMITSGTQQLSMTDADYSLITTDILGTGSSSGVLVSLRGNVLGIIDNSYETETPGGVVNAVGITELKPLIEKLSNREDKAYLGVQALDLTYALRQTYNLPEGIFIRYVEIDSPAMNAGLQNGDILTEVNGEKMNTFHDFILWLFESEPETTVNLKVLRRSVDTYVTVECEVQLGSISYLDKE